MIVWGTSDNALLERLLQKHNATLSKVISAGHAAEETRKHAHENLRSQPTTNIDKIFEKKLNQPSHNIHNQNTRDLTKKCKFSIVHIPEANDYLMKKFVMFAIKGTISKFAAYVLVKKYMKLKTMNLMSPLNRAIMNFSLKQLIFRTSYILTKSRMKILIGQ